MNINHYRQKGWVVIKDALNPHEVDMVKRIGEDMRLHAADYSTWSGISCAGNFNDRLFQSYTSDTMKELACEILGDEVYLFNDQIVIKLPNDRLRFEPHKDNQYGPNSDGSIHTVNMSWILDDFTEENGTLELQNQDDGEWVTIYPKKGDIVAIQGNTYHRSGKNRSIYSRGLYACVYTESPIHLEGFYTQRFV